MRPIFSPVKTRGSKVTSTMAKSGLNLRDLPQLLSVEYCLDNTNFFITSDGGLTKRGGMKQLFSVAGNDGIVMAEKYTDDLYIFGYANTVAAYRLSTGVVTNIKTNFVQAGSFSGQRYGDYFFVASPSDPIGRIEMTLDFNGQTVNFTVGQIITGGTSGATGTLLSQTDSGATGTLTLGSITGTFVNGEPITDPLGGNGNVDGVLDFTYTALSAPQALVIKASGARMYAGLSDGSVRYAATDTGTNPPFTNWTVATGATSPGQVAYRNAGKVNSIEPLGNLMLVFGDYGKWAFHTETIDSAGTLVKIDITDMFRQDSGGGRGAKTTKAGLAYVNSQGLWILTSVGQQNIKYSDQEYVSTLVLGSDYFTDFDYLSSDIAYIPEKQTILLTGAKDSSKNNIILTYNTEYKSIGKLTMSINRFMEDGGILFGSSSIDNSLHQLFTGNSDNGNEIGCTYYQELRVGDLETVKTMLGQYVNGKISDSSYVIMSFDIFDITGELKTNKLRLKWTTSSELQPLSGYGLVSWGSSPTGGGNPSTGPFEVFSGSRERINNFQRIRVKFIEHSNLPFQINWFSILTREKRLIRRRDLVKL